jgi:hypothetical protein
LFFRASLGTLHSAGLARLRAWQAV